MIITLCGSARFEDAFHYWNERLTMAGHVVFSLAVFPSQKGVKEWYNADQKNTLDIVHKQKIDASDAIFVITRPVEALNTSSGYIGDSTRSEITHAEKRGRRVLYDWVHWNVDNLPIAATAI